MGVMNDTSGLLVSVQWKVCASRVVPAVGEVSDRKFLSDTLPQHYESSVIDPPSTERILCFPLYPCVIFNEYI